MESRKIVAATVCVSAFIGCYLGVEYVGQQYRHALEIQSDQLAAEQASLKEELDATRLKLNQIPDWLTGLPVLDPTRLVEELYDLSDQPLERFREANFVFQALVDAGTNSIPAILGYFENGTDVTLLEKSEWESKVGDRTVRMGLIACLNNIGGIESVALLSRIIQVAANSKELSILVDSLMEADPDFYRPFCMKIARNTFRVLPAKSSKKLSSMDDFLACEEIYKILFEKLKDGELALELADKGAHINSAGVLDSHLMEYFSKALGADVGKICIEFFNAPETDRYSRVTFFDHFGMNDWAKQYIGVSPELTSMFNTVLQEGDNSVFRAKMIFSLTVWDTYQREAMPPDVAQIRLGLLDSFQSQYGDDPVVTRAIEQARIKFKYFATPDAYEEEPKADYTPSEEENADYLAFKKQIVDEHNQLMIEKMEAVQATKKAPVNP